MLQFSRAQTKTRHINLVFRKNRSGRLGELHFNFHTAEMRFEPLYESEDVLVDMPNGGKLPMKNVLHAGLFLGRQRS